MKKLLIFLPIILVMFISCKKTSKDKTAPVITLIGSPTVLVQKGTSYNDAGATASDETDGDITANIVVNNPVNVNVEDTIYVTYNVSDKAGNEAEEVKRKVIVTIF
jgi:hypothetical protein